MSNRLVKRTVETVTVEKASGKKLSHKMLIDYRDKRFLVALENVALCFHELCNQGIAPQFAGPMVGAVLQEYENVIISEADDDGSAA